jgi:CubicO group peptidase (beta-lactamase class C family)
VAAPATLAFFGGRPRFLLASASDRVLQRAAMEPTTATANTASEWIRAGLLAVLSFGCASPVATQDAICTGKCDAVHGDPAVQTAISELETFVQTKMASDQIPGVAIGVVHDQELLWAKGFGLADQKNAIPFTTDMRFRIASITKMFVAIATLELAQQGRIDLDAPIADQLKWFTLHDPEGLHPAEKITARQLLAHTAGISRDVGLHYWEGFYTEFPTSAEIIAALPDQEAVFEPGSRLKYSNLGYFLLGKLVEYSMPGWPWKRKVEKRVDDVILDRLDMHDTGFDLDDDDDIVIGYGRLKNGVRSAQPVIFDPEGTAAYAGMYSTVEDLARFIAWMNRAGDGASSGSSRAEILAPETYADMLGIVAANEKLSEAMGLGSWWYKLSGDLGFVVGYYGTHAGYRSGIFVNPVTKVGVVVMLNAWDVGPGPFVDKTFATVGTALGGNGAIREIDPALAPDPLPQPVLPPPRPEWADYVGTYTTERWVATITLDAEGYMLDSMNGGKRLVPTDDPRVFRVADDANWGNYPGELLEFDVAPHGEIASFTVAHGFTLTREPSPR